VTVSINSSANSLAVGSYSDTVTFTNLSNGNGSTTRAVSLAISNQPVNIAPLATVTATSDLPQYGMTAVKTVDGCIDGYPGISSCEWATNGERTGAWLNLSWSAPYSVNQLVLYDRPNTDDQVTSANIVFSDGTSITVGPLNNNGTATTYTFPARVITSLRMTVTGVSGRTQNVGLSELQVYGFPPNQYTLTSDVLPFGSGSISVSPSQASYNQDQQVTLTATPITGYAFSSWSGDVTGTANPLIITMTRNMAVNANFTALPGTLSILSTGNYTPVLVTTGSPTISWTFPNGTPAASSSATPGPVTFPDTTERASILTVNSPSTVTSFEIDVPEQGATQQAEEIKTVLGLEQLTGLTRLYLFDTGLTSLPNVNRLTSLQSLYCSHNYLGGTNLRWNGLTNLTMAHAFGNNFDANEVDQLFIDLDNNGISNGEFNINYNAGPSAASATARSNLEARGNILTYNTILSNPGYVPAVSTVGVNIQVAGGTRFTVTAPSATDIKVDIQDLGVQHISSGVEVFYYLGNPSQLRNITIETSPASALTGLAIQNSGRESYYYEQNPNYASVPYGNLYSISGLDRFPNLQQLQFYPANALNHVYVQNGVGSSLTFLSMNSDVGAGITSKLPSSEADSLIEALVAAGASNGTLYLPNRSTASDTNAATLRARGWNGQF
jgi:hypothetical protein